MYLTNYKRCQKDMFVSEGLMLIVSRTNKYEKKRKRKKKKKRKEKKRKYFCVFSKMQLTLEEKVISEFQLVLLRLFINIVYYFPGFEKDVLKKILLKILARYIKD